LQRNDAKHRHEIVCTGTLKKHNNSGLTKYFDPLLQHSEEGNQSVSVLSFVPGIDDDGKYLTCRAENTEINDSALEDRWRLNVHCEYTI